MGISVTKLLIVLGIAVVLFGTKRLRNAGSDIGAAIKNFRSAIKDGESGTKLNRVRRSTVKSQSARKGNDACRVRL